MLITTTTLAGIVSMENRRLMTFDDVQIGARVRELTSGLWKRREENPWP